MRRLFVSLLFVSLILTACTSSDTNENLTSLIGDINQNPKEYEGQTVTLIGYFRGQDLLDEVKGGVPPTDRFKDWVLKDNTGAIYIAKSDVMPLSTFNQDVWRVMRVTGQVKIFSRSMPYIVPQEIVRESQETYDVLPANCAIAIHRFGGPDKLDNHIYIYNNYNIITYDAKSEWRGLTEIKGLFPETELDELKKEFHQTGFFDLASTVGEPCQGCTLYYVAAVNEKTGYPHYVTLYQGAVPDKLQTFIDNILIKTAEAEPIQQQP